MSFEAIITLTVVGICFAVLAFTRTSPDITLVGGVSLLLVLGVLSPEQALSGLANQGVVTVGALYIVVNGLRETGGLSWIVQHLLGKPKSLMSAQLRMMAPVALLSAFLNNTPVVAMMIPAVSEWARRLQISTSKLMIPLSYAAIAGGTCTLIGTSTNLVTNGLLLEATNHDGIGMFELAWVGVPTVIVVCLFVLLLGQRFLPERLPPMSQFDDVRQYTVEMIVQSGSPLVGQTIEQADLRGLPGLYLIEIERGGDLLPAVSPQETLRDNDRLVFAGVVDSVVDLQKIRGLVPAADQIFKLNAPRRERCLVEAVVSNTCTLVGKSIREGHFRSVYDAVVIAVSRNGEQLRQKLGDIVLRAGDTLLIEAHPSFESRQRNSRDFLLVSQLHDSAPIRHDRAIFALVILVFMVLTATFGILSMLEAALLAAGFMLLAKCTSGRVARRSVDWQVLVVIAAALGLGEAVRATGAAEAVANTLMSISTVPWIALAMIYLLTVVFTAMISNNAAAVLMFPIALSVADRVGVDFMPFVITIMVAASASYATPIGYQTNLMVYGPGGYRFIDYIRIGVPITILVGILNIVIVPLIWVF